MPPAHALLCSHLVHAHTGDFSRLWICSTTKVRFNTKMMAVMIMQNLHATFPNAQMLHYIYIVETIQSPCRRANNCWGTTASCLSLLFHIGWNPADSCCRNSLHNFPDSTKCCPPTKGRAGKDSNWTNIQIMDPPNGTASSFKLNTSIWSSSILGQN